jgi:hypothetical protein
MTLFHSYHDRRRRPLTGFSVGRALRRLRAALKMIHRAIAAAKIHRVRNEFMLHGEAHEDWARLDEYEPDASSDNRFPRRPLHLGEKWDF